MTINKYAKLMTNLTQQPDWSIAYKQILAEIKSNDPRLNTLIDHFVQITPKTKDESWMMFYLLLSSMKILALDHLNDTRSHLHQ